MTQCNQYTKPLKELTVTKTHSMCSRKQNKIEHVKERYRRYFKESNQILEMRKLWIGLDTAEEKARESENTARRPIQNETQRWRKQGKSTHELQDNSTSLICA